MAITLEDNARNASVNAVAALLNGGTIQLQTSGGAEVATLTFGSPAFAPASGGTAAANAIAEDATAIAGTITQFVARNSASALVLSGSVSTIVDGTGDITMSSVVIADDETIRIDSMNMTQNATL